LPIFGNLFAYARDPLRYQERLVDQYGELVRYWLGRQEIVLTTNPDAVRQIFAADSDVMTKGRALNAARPIIGDGLLTSEGDTHMRRRRMLAPVFQPSALAAYATDMAEMTKAIVSTWELPSERDFAEEMMSLTLRLISRVLFHEDVEQDAKAISRAFDDAVRVVSRLSFPGYKHIEPLPFPSHRRFRKARTYLDTLVYRLIAARRRSSGGERDLLGRLVRAQDEQGGSGFTDLEIRDEVMTLVLAGHETTATSLAWLFQLVGRNPDVEQRLHAEISSVLNGRVPTLEDIGQMPYLKQVILETLRLRPPGWNLARRTVAPFEVLGHAIAPGTVLIVSPWVSQRRPEWFPRPTEFEPDRWKDNDPRRTHKFKYFPFGGGKRVCIGEHFAMLEMSIVVASVVQRMRVEALRPEIPITAHITLRPRGGVPVRVVPR
jgi:cytochrome P450